MNTNNNTLTEVLTYLLAIVVCIGGMVLLYLGKIDFAGASLFLGAGLGAVGLKFALQAPSSTQQGQLATLASQQNDVISKMVDQQTPPAPSAPIAAQPDPQPGQRFTTPVPQPYVPPVQQFVPQPVTAPQPWVPDGRNWSGIVPAVPISAQETQVMPTP